MARTKGMTGREGKSQGHGNAGTESRDVEGEMRERVSEGGGRKRQSQGGGW